LARVRVDGDNDPLGLRVDQFSCAGTFSNTTASAFLHALGSAEHVRRCTLTVTVSDAAAAAPPATYGFRYGIPP